MYCLKHIFKEKLNHMIKNINIITGVQSIFLVFNENVFSLEYFSTFNSQKNYVFSSLLIEEYFGIFIFFILATVIALVIAIASYSLTNQVPELEKLSPYECGFETYEAPRVKFEIKFCVIAILLIIFDVEMMYLFPWCVSVSKISMLGIWSMIDFIIELTFGYVYVIEKNALEW
uniref:NADH-ubiquinone oxidoreductase chain 3 n=1 Tax=Haslea nusantara TaxID=2600302 RepID=A0A5B8H9Z7_9STRA|nr:NADH dehydrogenase subunit 3 [Haslea nusantara]QDX17583.1 NADH dehydrogenase subunit 3 [Haslea nusantara]